MDTEVYRTRPDGRPPVMPPVSRDDESRRRGEDTTTAQIETGGSALEVVGGGGAIVLGILGLVGFYPSSFAEISAIAVGGGLLAHGIATAARWRDVMHRVDAQRVTEFGLGSEALGGAAGAVLGILALVGVVPMVLMPVSAIVLGAALLFAAPAQPELVTDGAQQRVVQAARAGGGIEGIAGVGSIVLGILALLGVASTVTLTLVSMIALGGGLLLAGGALAGIFSRRALHAHHAS